MYTISKQFEFEAAHRLTHVPEGHPCGNVHGHSYFVEVELFDKTNILLPDQWVKDFRELEPLNELIKTKFDHQFLTPQLLNEVAGFHNMILEHKRNLIKQTTSENMAYAIYCWCLRQDWPVSKVTVSETRKSRASFSIV